MSFTKEVMKDCEVIWNGYMVHPFIDDLRNNCMNENMFKHYLIQDTLYLKAYAKVFAMGIYKSESFAEMRLFYDLLEGVIQNESSSRETMLGQLRQDVNQIKEELTQENRDYITFLMDVAKHEGVVEILFATLPCMLSYAFIGRKLVEENPNIINENTYGSWIEEYACDEYLEKCNTWSQLADVLCEQCTKEEKKHLYELFMEASIHEMQFWNMSYEYKEDK